MLSTLLRQPMAILGAIGMVSLLKGVMQLHEDVLFVVNGFQAVTHPIWDYTIGYLTRWLGWQLPWWVKDYLTIGAIFAGAELRGYLEMMRRLFPRRRMIDWRNMTKWKWRRWIKRGPLRPVVVAAVWPAILLYWSSWVTRLELAHKSIVHQASEGKALDEVSVLGEELDEAGLRNLYEGRHALHSGLRIFVEFLVWAALIIAVNYALIFSGR